jgi:Ni2+-binding GTPase involved in maturation of urease and hydrogenase
VENARRVHPAIEILKVSCLTGKGLHDWLTWLDHRRRAIKSVETEAVT